MARTDPQVNVRLPADLKELLDDASARNGRSITAEVVDRLYRSFPSIETVVLENRNAELALIRADIEKRGTLVKSMETELGAGGLTPKRRAELEGEVERHKTKLLWYKSLTGPILAQALHLTEAAERMLQQESKQTAKAKKQKRQA